MSKFKALIGDLFLSRAQTLVNTVNCVGIMGKGVAQEFKKRFPAMFDDYKHRCDMKAVRLGEPYLYRDASGVSIINFPTKDHWRSPSKLSDIERGLDYFVEHVSEWEVRSIALPPLGCGNGGLDWSEVGPLIYSKLHKLPIDIELYAPFGTPKQQLTIEFLAAPSQMSLEGKGRRLKPIRPEWAVLLEVLRELENQPYANPVGRTIFQKICYVVTEMGVPTGLHFGKGSYGPFSSDVSEVMRDFANRNWLIEKQMGRMMALSVSAQYLKDRNSYEAAIEPHRRRISKAVDLFSRIKSTQQAEEVFTVLFASRQLKQSVSAAEITEGSLINYILDWKKSWQSDDKRVAIATAIHNLAMLGWLRVALEEPAVEAH